jgi:hypothetical protein
MLRNQVAEMEGVEMTSTEEQRPEPLTDEEKRILDVYDRLEELQLEIALLKAQGVLSQGESSKLAKQDRINAYGLQMSLWMSPRRISALPDKNF